MVSRAARAGAVMRALKVWWGRVIPRTYTDVDGAEGPTRSSSDSNSNSH
jgi:hypothetical protein